MNRRNTMGFFWEDAPIERSRGRVERSRPTPAIPDNGWRPPKEFPRLDSTELLGIDIETKDPDLQTKGPGVRRGSHIVGLSVATIDRAWYFPMRHEIQTEMNLDPDKVLQWARRELTRPTQPKVGTNILYDADFLLHEGIDIGKNLHDIQVAEALIDENRFTYSLEALAQDYLDEGKVTFELETWAELAFGKARDFRENIYRCPPSLVGPYAEGDAILPLRILQAQRKRLDLEEVSDLYEVERGLIHSLLHMRRRGVAVNLERATEVESLLETNIARDLLALKDMVGFEINVNAGDSLAKAFDKLGLLYGLTAKTKKPSFTKEFLEHHSHPVAKQIMHIRRWQKFLGTFIRGYIYDLHVNNRIHCLFNQTRNDDYGTVSGRFSSSNPNLQNIPARDEEWAPIIRSIFIPDDGEIWGRYDWSQIEFRFLTHYGVGVGAEKAREMYRKDPKTDFHQMVSDLTSVRRKDAKNINFALVYGQGKESTAQQLGIPLSEAEPIFDQYHSRLPFVRKTYEHYSKLASRDGFIRTILGRKRRFNMWQPMDEFLFALPYGRAKNEWPNQRLRRAGTHKGLNAELQGSAADIMKLAMWMMAGSGAFDILGYPLLIVHDEFDFSIPPGKAAREALAEVTNIMENCIKLSIPIMVDYSEGKDWGVTSV